MVGYIGHMADQGCTSPHQGVERRGFVGGGLGVPAAREDTDPLARQGAGRGLMGTALSPLLGIVGTRPERMAEGCAGPCHEGLAKTLRALESPVDPARLPAAFSDGGHARILLELRGGGIACTWFATGDEETRGEDGSGAWERLKAGAVGMGGGQLGQGVVNVLEGRHSGTELGHQGPDAADVGPDDARIGRERHGRWNRLKALRDEACVPMVLAKAARQGGTAGQVDGFEGRPLAETITEDGGVFVGAPGQDLREVMFQGARETVAQTDLVLPQAPAACHALG
jgi:hypothetical protein